MKNTKKFFSINALAFGLLALGSVTLSGCGENGTASEPTTVPAQVTSTPAPVVDGGEEKSETPVIEATPDSLAETIYGELIATGAFTEMSPLDDSYIKKIYGIDRADYDELVYAEAEDPMFADLIIIAKPKTDETLDSLAAFLTDFAKRQKELFASYAPEQAKVMEGAVMEQRGGYIYLLVCPDTTAPKKVMNERIK